MSEFEIRWRPARKMWELGYTKAQIAEVYEVSEKALKTRIQRWRRERGWFPKRRNYASDALINEILDPKPKKDWVERLYQ